MSIDVCTNLTSSSLHCSPSPSAAMPAKSIEHQFCSRTSTGIWLSLLSMFWRRRTGHQSYR